MATWYTSDLHLGHLNIIEYCRRPFSSVEDMNEGLIARWNDVVDDDDVVYVLGDVALGKIKESLPLVARLKGHKIQIPGNHDRNFRGHHKNPAGKDQMYLDAGFERIIPTIGFTYVGGKHVKMCHFPYEGDSHDADRFDDMRPIQLHNSEWLLHGHVHDKWQINGHQINVGVDVWDFFPVHESVIARIIDES